MITCPNGDVPTFTFREFSTEADYDFVSLYDGADVASSQQVAHLSGVINTLPGYDATTRRVTYGGTSPSMTLQFTSDESVSAGGFEVIYSCGLTAPPPPPVVTPPPPAPPSPPACESHPCVHGVGGEDGHGCTSSLDAPICHDTCLTHNDNECDDGGVGSLYNVCAMGSDCSDCGTRVGFTCNCDTGYNGLTCDTAADPCATVHCINGGICEQQCFLGLCAASCSCPLGYDGESCENSTPPPPPASRTAVTIATPMTGEVLVAYERVYFTLDAVEGHAYILDTEVGSLTDTVMTLYGTDGTTQLAENDDDSTQQGASLDSYIEWTCPTTGSYTIEVYGFANSIGSFTLTVTEAMNGPCAPGGITLLEPVLEIAFQPVGGTGTNQVCIWSIICRPDQLVTVHFEEFETEAKYVVVRKMMILY